MTTSLTLRSVKGSALTHNEVDANFTALRTTADGAPQLTTTNAFTAHNAMGAESGVNGGSLDSGGWSSVILDLEEQSATNMLGLQVYAVGVPTTSSKEFTGAEISAMIKAANAQNVAQLVGTWAYAGHAGTGTLTSSIGLLGQADTYSSGTTQESIGVSAVSACSSTATLTTSIGLQATANNQGSGTVTTSTNILSSASANTGGGTITTQIGLDIGNQTPAGRITPSAPGPARSVSGTR